MRNMILVKIGVIRRNLLGGTLVLQPKRQQVYVILLRSVPPAFLWYGTTVEHAAKAERVRVFLQENFIVIVRMINTFIYTRWHVGWRSRIWKIFSPAK